MRTPSSVEKLRTPPISMMQSRIEIARHLWQTLDMPQRPDGMTISDGEGNKLYSGRFDPDENSG
jgi:hypothetical protein